MNKIKNDLYYFYDNWHRHVVQCFNKGDDGNEFLWEVPWPKEKEKIVHVVVKGAWSGFDRISSGIFYTTPEGEELFLEVRSALFKIDVPCIVHCMIGPPRRGFNGYETQYPDVDTLDKQYMENLVNPSFIYSSMNPRCYNKEDIIVLNDEILSRLSTLGFNIGK